MLDTHSGNVLYRNEYFFCKYPVTSIQYPAIWLPGINTKKPPTIKPAAISPPYHIVITRKNQVLLSFLRIRAIVNGKEIYPLQDSKPVMLTVMENHPKVVVTDGYHFTQPVELVYHHLNTYYFKVICVIDDLQLIAGSILLIVLYLLGFYTDAFILKLTSFLPIIYFLFYYYINRKDFIQITPV